MMFWMLEVVYVLVVRGRTCDAAAVVLLLGAARAMI
jgi:hypothetical protein